MADGVRTIAVEILRPGPNHNHVLSPLTRYLAVCGDAHAGEVSPPYEHAQLLSRLRELRYTTAQTSESEPNRRFAVSELARAMSSFLSQVPGLVAQLSSRSSCGELINLQIMANAAELALLPFELAGNVDSLGREVGDYLLLGARPRVTLTRRLRGAGESCAAWPTKPKILFVAASPTREVPYERHLDALIRALALWIPPASGPSDDPESTKIRIDEWNRALRSRLHVIEHAAISDVAKLCSQHDFTHVHVLAHGAIDEGSPGRQFGLALHANGAPTQAHVVSGAQFASAIRRKDGAMPSVVTLASCDSGNNEDVLYSGASLAFEVHRSGVPFVLASQLPLSVEASVDVCEYFYRGLLRGEDPRELLHQLRVRLHSHYASRTHDWATLIAYAALPNNFEELLVEVKYTQARLATNVALDYFDRETKSVSSWPANTDSAESPATKLRERVEQAAKLVPCDGKYAVEGYGLLGAFKKRTAQFYFTISQRSDATAQREDHRRQCREHLEESAAHYEQAFVEGVTLRSDAVALASTPTHWPIVQLLSLNAALQRPPDFALLATARTLCSVDIDRGSRDAELWALTSLLEVQLLEAWLKKPGAEGSLVATAQRVVTLSGTGSEVVHSTHRQLRRYVDWWWDKDFMDSIPAGDHARHEVSPELSAQVEAAIKLMNAHLTLHTERKPIFRKR